MWGGEYSPAISDSHQAINRNYFMEGRVRNGSYKLSLGWGGLKQHDCCSGPHVLQPHGSLCGLKVLVGLGGEGGGREKWQ